MNTHKPTIMVVDDTPGDIDALANILTDHYEITVATSGRNAMEMACSQRPDLIFLGLSLRDMDGHETCRQLKSHHHCREIPVIFSASPEEEAQEQSGLEAGAVDYIRQPFHPAVVRSRVAMHLQHKQQRQEMETLLRTDRLTGVANAQGFAEALHREWQRSIRDSVGISVLLLEIDWFRAFTASHGQDHSLLCLNRVARTLGHTVRRATDCVARLGDGRFAVVLSHTDWPGSQLLAERTLSGVEALAIPHTLTNNRTEGITVSIGYASQIPKKWDASEPLLDAADTMLHRARENGGNQARGTRLPVETPKSGGRVVTCTSKTDMITL